jgi:hypothetical protein
MRRARKITNYLIVLFLLGLFCHSAMAQARRNQPPPRPVASPSPKPATVKVDMLGTFDGAVYRNQPLGFRITLPEGWQAQDDEVKKQLAEGASENTADITRDRRAAKDSIARSTLLFVAVRPSDSPTNPTVLCMVEDVALVFNVRTPRQYLQSMRSIIDERAPIIFDDEITVEQISGVEFGVLGARLRDSATKVVSSVRQRYYVTLKRNKAIGFVLTYHDDKELQQCLELIHTFRFQ